MLKNSVPREQTLIFTFKYGLLKHETRDESLKLGYLIVLLDGSFEVNNHFDSNKTPAEIFFSFLGTVLT